MTPVSQTLRLIVTTASASETAARLTANVSVITMASPFANKDAPGPVNEKQTQALLLPSPPRRGATQSSPARAPYRLRPAMLERENRNSRGAALHDQLG